MHCGPSNTRRRCAQASQFDEAKRIFLEGNPYFLALTLVVSLLHTVFDALAFKSDVGFWKANKSMEGLSARTVLINAGCQVVVFLYVLNNETSMLILGSVGAGSQVRTSVLCSWRRGPMMTEKLLKHTPERASTRVRTQSC